MCDGGVELVEGDERLMECEEDAWLECEWEDGNGRERLRADTIGDMADKLMTRDGARADATRA